MVHTSGKKQGLSLKG